MTVATIDNTTGVNLSRVITWQYDNATNLIAIIDMLTDFFNQSTASPWYSWVSKVVNINTADDYGLAIWGNLLKVERPTLTVGTESQILSKELYRKLLKARFQLLGENASLDSYCKYINAVFSGNVVVTDNNDMSLTFAEKASGSTMTAEERALISQRPDIAFVWPAGVKSSTLSTDRVFGFDGQQQLDATKDPLIGKLYDGTNVAEACTFAYKPTKNGTYFYK